MIMTPGQKEDLMVWSNQQHSPELPTGPFQYPEDPQLAKAVAVLREALRIGGLASQVGDQAVERRDPAHFSC